MKVLIISSGNSGNISTFVQEQGSALQKKGIEVDYFPIIGKNYSGYLGNLARIKTKISSFNPDLIHAHFGLSALLANLQRRVPVISTFHGSDIWVYRKNRFFSQIAHLLSTHTIIVDPGMSEYLIFSKRISNIPCGVEDAIFFPVDKHSAIEKMNLSSDKVNILFASKFDYFEKNHKLAIQALHILGEGYNLIELNNYSRPQVNLLLNGCDIILMTSISEGSPQIIKEAMACNCPIVSTDVGDVKKVFGNTKGCFITSFNPADVAEKIKAAVEFRKKTGHTQGRERIIELGLDSESVAGKVIEVYKKVLKIPD